MPRSIAAVEYSEEHQRMKQGVSQRVENLCLSTVALPIASTASAEGRLSQHKPSPNPSIEGTSNIWLRQLSAAPHVKR